MAVLYLAERSDREFRRRVVIKVIKRGMDSDQILARFRSERQILASLDHPNIARLYDGGSTPDGRPYFAMEYVEDGLPIGQYCDSRGLALKERTELFMDVLSAVEYAHQHLIVHRDLASEHIVKSCRTLSSLPSTYWIEKRPRDGFGVYDIGRDQPS